MIRLTQNQLLNCTNLIFFNCTNTFRTARYWLPVRQRIEYKLCMTVHRCLHGEAQGYLADLITPSATATARAGLRSATSGSVAVLRHHLVTARSLWPLRHQHLVELILLTLSNAN